MADSRRGKKLTEDHRQAQLAVRAAFLRQFVELWPMLDPERLDETGAAWVRTVMDQVRLYREESAQAAERYYRDFRLAEAPTDMLSTPVAPVIRESSTGTSRRPRQAGRKSDGTVPVGTGKLVKPTLVFSDEAATTGLIVTGPVNVKSKTKRGKTAKQAADLALVEASGAASRSVLTGGRQTHLELVHNDPSAIGFIRVTDGNPCAFCAMLASRGPQDKRLYRSAQSAETVVNPGAKRALGDAYHDHCGCVAEAVYSRSQEWPGRGREFEDLWRKVTKGLKGKDAFNAFRRAHERGIREAGQEREAG